MDRIDNRAGVLGKRRVHYEQNYQEKSEIIYSSHQKHSMSFFFCCLFFAIDYHKAIHYQFGVKLGGGGGGANISNLPQLSSQNHS